MAFSNVYKLPQRRDIENRTERLAGNEDRRLKERKPAVRKSPVRISSEIEDRVVTVSLDNPEYGARRLVSLLKLEEILISESAVYAILKRNGLQNRTLRLLKLEAQQTLKPAPSPIDTAPPAAEERVRTVQVSADEDIRKADRPPKVRENTAQKVLPSPSVPLSRMPPKTKTRGSLVLKLINGLLFGLLIILVLHTVENVRNVRNEPSLSLPGKTTPYYIVSAPEKVAQPLDDYRIIWKRNLFNTSPQEVSNPKKKIVVEKLPPAQTDLGLILVGTVLADDPRQSRAFIDNRRTGKQEIFSEGDRVGDALIKKFCAAKWS